MESHAGSKPSTSFDHKKKCRRKQQQSKIRGGILGLQSSSKNKSELSLIFHIPVDMQTIGHFEHCLVRLFASPIILSHPCEQQNESHWDRTRTQTHSARFQQRNTLERNQKEKTASNRLSVCFTFLPRNGAIGAQTAKLRFQLHKPLDGLIARPPILQWGEVSNSVGNPMPHLEPPLVSTILSNSCKKRCN